MTRTTIHRLLTLALVAAVSVSLFYAFVLLSPPRTWDSAPTLIVDDQGLDTVTDNDGGVSATVQAINSNQAWNGAGSGTVVNAQAGSIAGYTLGDGQPMLAFSDPVNACKGNCLAATFTGFFSDRGDGTVRIDDADIVTNLRRIDWTSQSEDPNGAGCNSEFYIEGVMVHEVGHLLGLGHTDVSGATMFPSVSSCNNGPATTEQDDEDGLNALYSGNPPGGDGGGACSEASEPCKNNNDCCPGLSCTGRGNNKTCA